MKIEMTLSLNQLQELEKLESKATPGVWRNEDHRDDGDWRSCGLIWAQTEGEMLPGDKVCIIDGDDLHSESGDKIKVFEATAKLICETHNALPQLLQMAKDSLRYREVVEFYAQLEHSIKYNGETPTKAREALGERKEDE